MLIVSWVIAAATVVAVLDAVIGSRRIRDLGDISPLRTGPAVSVVVAARNEERGIEAATRSLLRLDYAPLEIIVVNDRSTDATPAILERIQRDDPRLIVVTVQALPEGWLGKNHALAVGAARATGDVLLFTDADVEFEPTTIARAVRVLEDDRLDHLTALPHVRLEGVALTTLVVAFGMLFGLYSRPWKARDPKSRCHIGVGAFNLLRTSAYLQLGTHAVIALRPDDDMRLANAVKRAGLRQDVVRADAFIELEWYASAGEMVDGLMKNAFAGINYRVTLLLASTAALVAFHLWPWLALVVAGGTVRRLSAVTVLVTSSLVFAHTRRSRVSAVYVLLYPVGVLGFIYIMWRSAWLALSRRAISWRGTSYSLAALKRAAPAARIDN